MTEYRIVTDGLRFKIHYLTHSWWFKKPKWRVLGRSYPDLGWMSIVVYSKEEAKKIVREHQAEDKARKQGYQIIAEY